MYSELATHDRSRTTPPAAACPAQADETLLERARARLRYALQPIVNIHTGAVFGYEALLRGVHALDFPTVQSFMGAAWRAGIGTALDSMLREQAIATFIELPDAQRYRLFFNLDPHLIEHERPEQTLEILRRHGLGPESMCLELSEQADHTGNPAVERAIQAYRAQGFHFAIDDFGSGYAGLRLLYEHPPNILKIDRFFIRGMAEDQRKRLFVANTVQLAHLMGIGVIAEGVETDRELLACREVGCDLVQGYLVAHPQLDLDALRSSYAHVEEIHQRNRREAPDDWLLIEQYREFLPPLSAHDSVGRIFDAFRQHKGHHFVPVVDRADRPMGLIHEVDIKDFIYSAYGRDLMLNRAFAREILDFVRPCPTVDIFDSAERLLEAYSATPSAAGILLTQDGRYDGFISATALLQLVGERKLASARNENPLTKLPANKPVHRYVSEALGKAQGSSCLVYFDFDNFKAFNDHYGFRRGDRAIQMFAQLIRDQLCASGWFVGHIGGDDFFAGAQDLDSGTAAAQIEQLLAKFASDVQSLYDPADRARGHLECEDRYGELRKMPLMRCSAALLVVRPGSRFRNGDELGRTIAALKHQAKASSAGLVTHGAEGQMP
ncbi:GGDEF domain-containing protein [Thiorhodococcus minor]|uniref:EAL domain-containing protein n=1 Tax=Thiorhodococcus minor TaxID=57489 RepID=A0A6M0K466_9GAMM|nr:GGDEF domain-containing protein [Thiorhodococcus minor]NEV64582.1 EAL domain-containing protein [Thiorhodococcus minor]